MTYEANGKTLEATESGYLVNQDDWDKDVAEAIVHAVTRPPHVCVNEVVVRPTGQAR